MWRIIVEPVIQKQVPLLRTSSGSCKSQFCCIHLTGNRFSGDSSKIKVIEKREPNSSSQNMKRATNALVGLFLKQSNGYKAQRMMVLDGNSAFSNILVCHIKNDICLKKGNCSSAVKTCTPNTDSHEKGSGFDFKTIYMDLQKWCYGVVVASSLISWHRLLFKKEKLSDHSDNYISHVLDFPSKPLYVLPVNSPAKPVDPLDAVFSSLESAMSECTAVTENALAIRFSTLKLNEKAMLFFKSASSRGNVAAHFNVGLCYEKGIGTLQDISKAVSFYMLAASQDHLLALFNLGLIFLDGKHFDDKKTEGLELMEKAARGGLTKAQTFLGLYYADNSNENHDMKKSVHWLEIAAEKKDAKAQYHAGVCYEKGLGVARNMQKAKEMYRAAAENGHQGGQYNCGVFHEYGLGGLSIDKHEALRWYKAAAESGNIGAKHSVERIQKEIPGLGTGKRSLNLLEKLFSDNRITQPSVARNGVLPRCSSSPDRLFQQSEAGSNESLPMTDVKDSKSFEDSNCIWVI